MTTKNIYRRVSKLLEPGELEHLEKIAEWLDRPAYAVIVDEIRRQYGRYTIDGDYKVNKVTSLDAFVTQDGNPIHFSDESIPLIDTLINKENIEYLYSRIDLLDEDQKNVLRARLNGTSCREIAKQYRWSLTHVDNVFRRAKTNLAGLLIPSYFLSA